MNKLPGSDNISPLFFKLAAGFISLLMYLFDLSLLTNTIRDPKIRKSAFVVPLSKWGDPSLMDNYSPISKLGILLKLSENLVSKQLTPEVESNELHLLALL